MSLSTVLRHEVGHALGLGHSDGLMAESLSDGESRSVSSAAAALPEFLGDNRCDLARAGG